MQEPGSYLNLGQEHMVLMKRYNVDRRKGREGILCVVLSVGASVSECLVLELVLW